mmetsp:Transcript_81786/g.240103  ORF Transcript_81786/g.240103 Transcript_81786/m.240103 type:complete len:257 (+) Transcript_81786:354-1124(+)
MVGVSSCSTRGAIDTHFLMGVAKAFTNGPRIIQLAYPNSLDSGTNSRRRPSTPQNSGGSLALASHGSTATRLARSFPSGMKAKSKLTVRPWSTWPVARPPGSSDLRKKMSSARPCAVMKPKPFATLNDLTTPMSLDAPLPGGGCSATPAVEMSCPGRDAASADMTSPALPCAAVMDLCCFGCGPWSVTPIPGPESRMDRFAPLGGGVSVSPTSRARHFPHLPSGNACSQKQTVQPTRPPSSSSCCRESGVRSRVWK